MSKLSHFIKPVTFCNNYLSHFAMTTEWNEIQDLEPGNQYLGPRILDLRLKIQIRTVDTRRKLNVQKTYRRRPGRLLNVLCLLNVLRTFNLCPVSTGQEPELGIQEFRSKTKNQPRNWDLLPRFRFYITKCFDISWTNDFCRMEIWNKVNTDINSNIFK